MKLKVLSVEGLKQVLTGVITLTSAACLDISEKGTKISIMTANRIRAFVTTNLLVAEAGESVQLAFEEITKLRLALQFITETSDAKEIELTTNGKFLEYKGLGAFKLKLDALDRVEAYVSPPIKTELQEIFSFKIKRETIKQIATYSNFNTNYEIKLYFAKAEDGWLKCDIDNRSENNGRLSVITIPITDKIKGDVEQTVMDLNDLNTFNIWNQNEILITRMDKCISVTSNMIINPDNKENRLGASLHLIAKIVKD